MTDSIFDSLRSQQAPSGDDTPTPQPDMLSYANSQLATGMSADDAIEATYSKYPTQSGVRFGMSPDGKSFKDLAAPTSGGIFSDYDSQGNLQGGQHLTKEQIIVQNPSAARDSAKPDSPGVEFGKTLLSGIQTGILNPAMRAQSQATNFLINAGKGTFDTEEGGKVSPEQSEAAKLIGADVGKVWGPIQKMTPQQLAKYRADADTAAGLDPKEQAARDEQIASGGTYSGPIEGLLQHSAVKDLIASAFNPNESNTILYHKVNEVAHLLDIEKNPSNYSGSQVETAKKMLEQYREDAKKSTWDKTKEAVGEAAKHPLALVNSTLADPELFLAPEVKLGQATYEAKAVAAARAADKAAQYQKLAESISMAGKGIPDIEEAANAAATHHGDQAEKLLKQAQALRTKQFLGDVGSAAGSGAAINAAITAEQQTAQQGYVKKGSVAPAAVIGATLGGGLAALGEAGSLRSRHGDLASRVDEATTREAGPDGEGAPVQDPNAGRQPGQPLSPETPINKESHVPYYGGVDKDGHVIHLDENTPEFKTLKTMDGGTKNVPVLKTVAYHEQVEYPLMHMEGPISPATLTDLQGRMSVEDWDKIPKDVIQKLKDGKSLTYPEAHTYFATAAENHLVKTLYKVDPKVYQDSLKPHIKDIAEANKTASPSDIPANLDSKPYDDMGGTSSLKGEGARPDVDQVEPGADEHADNRARGQSEGEKWTPEAWAEWKKNNPALARKLSKGQIDPALLATGVTTAAGAIAGGTLADQDHKYAGTIFGALAGLAAGHVMSRGDVGASGLGKSEAGMFGGAGSRGYDLKSEQMANRLYKIGKTPDEIWEATGMARGPAGNWYREFSDKDVSVKSPQHWELWERAEHKPIPLSEVMTHTKLEEEYPGILDKVKIKIDTNMQGLGSYNPATDVITLRSPKWFEFQSEGKPWMSMKSVLTHELQHYIQKVEGMPGGTSVAYMGAQADKVIEHLYDQFESVFQKLKDAHARGEDTSNLEARYEKVNEKIKEFEKQNPKTNRTFKAEDLYAREAGETQARNTQTRLKLSEEERAAKSPFQTQDYPNREQVINRQMGSVDPELLKKIAKTAVLGTIGATLGTYLDPNHKVKGAWAGAAMALVGGEINWSKLYPSIKEIQSHDPRFNVNDILDNWDHARAASQRTTYQVQKKVVGLAPDKASQIKITHWLDGDKSIPLTNKEYEAAKIIRQFYDSLGQAALHEGVLKDFLADYVNHEWGDNAKAKALQDQIEASITTNMSPKDRHALARKYMTIAQGKEAGLTPRTENIVELLGIYSDSMSRAMANKTLLDSLKVSTLDPQGEVKAVMPAGKAPYSYVPINHPQLGAVRVHPSIAPSLDFLFHTYKKNAAVNAFESANTAIKRMQVSFSMFHVKSLIDAYLGANTLAGSFKNLYDISTSLAGKSAAHRMYASGAAGDAIDAGLRGGLKLDMGSVSSEDVNAHALYAALDHTSNFLDNIIPGAGKLPAAIKGINKLSDKFIWENAHSGFKGMTFMNVYERLQRSWAKERANNPNAKVPSNDELAKHAASFTNDVFGGVNWRRMADDAQTKYGRAVGLAMASPAGRRLGQVTMFAPDWTYSTIRSWTKAVGQGSGVKGLLSPKTMADLHRQYIVRSGFIYLTLYNAVNMAMSGHPIWDNKDPLMVDLGNGEKMQANKHFLEVPHAVTDPFKFMLGKLGTLPSEALDQAFHKEYLTPQGGPPMGEGRLEHAASRLLPFSLENNNQGGAERAMSMLGFPVYGQTKEQKRAQAKAEAQQAREERRHREDR